MSSKNKLISPEKMAADILKLGNDACKESGVDPKEFWLAFERAWWHSDMGGRAPAKTPPVN